MSAAAFVLIIGLIVPALNDGGAYGYMSAYADVLRRPWTLPLLLVTPPVKLETAILWFAPFVFLSLASPLAIVVLPIALTRFLSDTPTHWGTVFHYSAPIAPIVAMSAADGLARIARRWQQNSPSFMAWAVAASVLCSAILPGRQPLWRVFAPRHYEASETTIAGRAALRSIPANASIVAQAAIVPHLSSRDRIYVLDDQAPDADYVVASDSLSPWPSTRFSELRALLEQRQARRYSVAFQQDGWIVLRRP